MGTKTDTPVMDTPLDVVSVSQQVLKDQQITDLAQALQNVSGVTVARGSGFSNGLPYQGIMICGFGNTAILTATDSVWDGAPVTASSKWPMCRASRCSKARGRSFTG